MAILDLSPEGKAFVDGHEGNVLTCYLDPVKIPTIGRGYTMRSDSCRRELAKLGITKLVPGKTKITRAQSDTIFSAVIQAEYMPAVVASAPATIKQHQADAACSAAFNLGVGVMKWEWAKLWRAGKIAEAAAYLGSHYNTAGGKKLSGLVRRRKEEALLFERGIYSGVSSVRPEGVARNAIETPPALPDPVVKEAQELLTSAGLNPGAIDGWMGEKTKEAVIAYQKAHPHLVADGVIGPATLAQLRRDATAAREALMQATGGGIGSALAAWHTGLPWGLIAAGVVAVALAYVAYRNRDLIARRWNTFRGVEVPV